MIIMTESDFIESSQQKQQFIYFHYELGYKVTPVMRICHMLFGLFSFETN